jgi:hypothetical protein
MYIISQWFLVFIRLLISSLQIYSTSDAQAVLNLLFSLDDWIKSMSASHSHNNSDHMIFPFNSRRWRKELSILFTVKHTSLQINIWVGLSTLSICPCGILFYWFTDSRSNNQTDQETRERNWSKRDGRGRIWRDLFKLVLRNFQTSQCHLQCIV